MNKKLYIAIFLCVCLMLIMTACDSDWISEDDAVFYAEYFLHQRYDYCNMQTEVVSIDKYETGVRGGAPDGYNIYFIDKSTNVQFLTFVGKEGTYIEEHLGAALYTNKIEAEFKNIVNKYPFNADVEVFLHNTTDRQASVIYDEAAYKSIARPSLKISIKLSPTAEENSDNLLKMYEELSAYNNSGIIIYLSCEDGDYCTIDTNSKYHSIDRACEWLGEKQIKNY